jgi:5'(3')-deoxyribonucleotidase
MKWDSLKDLDANAIKPGSFAHQLKKIEEQGRIVPGVNTTVDVGPNEIKTQTAKFGNTVDKDGRPPTLSKKVRGSSTNVLFNLKEHIESVDKSDDHVLQYTMLEAKLGEIGSASKIYVDMDGVLADFFGEWAKLMKVDHYRKIDDLDINVALQKIRDTEQFWLDLPLLPQAKELLGLIKKVKGEYYICSTPLADDPKSEPHKREWIKKNLAFFPPKDVYITSNKSQYAKNEDGTPNILIDDFGKNVNEWDAAGGTGFKYKDHKFERTAKELQQHMNEPVEEGDHIPNPKNSFITKADTAYDFIKIGTNLANLKDVPKGSNADEPDIMISPYAGKKEMKYLQKELKRIGYDVQDNDGYQDAHYDESITGGEAPPQVKNEGRLGRLKISKMRPVQKKRKFSKLFNQLKRIGEDNLAPITVDKHGHIVNGHHRYDALRLVGEEYATVRMLDVHVSETMSENFADGKKKGKSKPGRVKKSGASCNGSVTSLRTKAKKYSGEKAKMFHWCANMKSGRKKK